jgi:hypothetical protein
MSKNKNLNETYKDIILKKEMNENEESFKDYKLGCIMGIEQLVDKMNGLKEIIANLKSGDEVENRRIYISVGSIKRLMGELEEYTTTLSQLKK